MCPGMSRNMGSGYLVEMIVHIFLSNLESQLFQVFSRVLCARLDSLQIFSNFQQVIVLGRSQSQFVVRFPAISGQPTHFSYPCSQVAVLSELAILGRTFSRQFGTMHGFYLEHSTPLFSLRKSLHGYLKGVPSPHLTSHSLAPGRRMSLHTPRPSYISSDLCYHDMHLSMPQLAPIPP